MSPTSNTRQPDARHAHSDFGLTEHAGQRDREHERGRSRRQYDRLEANSAATSDSILTDKSQGLVPSLMTVALGRYPSRCLVVDQTEHLCLCGWRREMHSQFHLLMTEVGLWPVGVQHRGRSNRWQGRRWQGSIRAPELSRPALAPDHPRPSTVARALDTCTENAVASPGLGR